LASGPGANSPPAGNTHERQRIEETGSRLIQYIEKQASLSEASRLLYFMVIVFVCVLSPLNSTT
jgi:hypothetical protein